MSAPSSLPDPLPQSAAPDRRRVNVSKIAMWFAIGMLVFAALLGGFFIIVGDQSNVAGRAWMTLFLVGAFAGAVLLDTAVTRGGDTVYLAASTIVNVVLVAVGLLKIWNGFGQPADTASALVWSEQIMRFVAVVLLLRAALAVTQIYVPFAYKRSRGTATKIAALGSVLFGWITALILAIPAAFPAPEWPDWWWRASGASALIAVVLLVIPPILRAFEPRDETAQLLPAGYPQQAGAAAPYPQAAAPVSPQQGYPQQYPPQGYPQPGYAPAQQTPEQAAYAQQQAAYAAQQQAAYAAQQQAAYAQQQAQYAAQQQAAQQQAAQYAAQQANAQAQFDAEQAARAQAAAEAARRSADAEGRPPVPPQ